MTGIEVLEYLAGEFASHLTDAYQRLAPVYCDLALARIELDRTPKDAANYKTVLGTFQVRSVLLRQQWELELRGLGEMAKDAAPILIASLAG